jgi:hypothetical protein
MTVLVTVKAYPSISTKYGEAICVAGVRIDTETPEWVRFFPVRFRELPPDRQFRKYQVIRLSACKHTGDRRRETWRPNVDSIECFEMIGAGGPWHMRRGFVEPLLGPTMCDLSRGRSGGQDAPSLGLVRPAQVRSIRVREEEPWSLGQIATLEQGNLLTSKSRLVKPAHAFSYSYLCEAPDCKGHVQKIVDWELGEAYRTWRERGNGLVEAIKQRWLHDMCDESRDTLFFVGDQHTRPGKFLILGTFYPAHYPNAAQLSFQLAA